MKKLLATAAITAAMLTAAQADTLVYRAANIELEMKKGAFSADNERAQQLITIRNKSSVSIKDVWVECGFFHGDLLIGRGTEWASNLEPGQDGYLEFREYVLSADRTDCRFTRVTPR